MAPHKFTEHPLVDTRGRSPGQVAKLLDNEWEYDSNAFPIVDESDLDESTLD